MDGLLVGRKQELARLRGAADDVLRTGGRVISVAGGPGIGKTRTVEELAAYGGVRGYQVIWGRCHAGDGMPAYWPWVQILRSAMRGRDPTWHRKHSSELVPHFGHALPALRPLVSEMPAPPIQESESNRYFLFATIANFILSLADTQPLMLILEDLHWADASSLLMLEYLAVELENQRVIVVGTYRDPVMPTQRALVRALGELPRTRGFMHLRLERLGPEDVRRYLHAALGINPSQDIVEVLSRRCEGNPFVMTEMARLLEKDVSWDEAPEPGTCLASESVDWDVVLPEGVEAAIRSRCTRLSESCNRILDLAAAVGREFDVELLERAACNLDERQLRAALEEASAAWLIAELPGVAGRYQFTHILIRDSVYAGLPPHRRAALHRTIGRTLAALYESESEIQPAEIASHFERAESHADQARAIHFQLFAGDQALAVYAYEEAESCFRRALKRVSDDTEPSLTGRALFGLGRAEGALGKVLDAWRSVRQAVDLFIAADDVSATVRAARFPLFYVPGVPAPTQLVTDALKLVPATSREAGELLCRYALLLNLERADDPGARAALDNAIEIAHEHDDVELEMQALTNAADIAWYHLRHTDALASSTRAIELAHLTDSLHAEAWPRFLAASTAWFTGDLSRFTHHTLSLLETAQQVRNHGFLGHAFLLRAMMAYATGDLKMARTWVRRGADVAPDFFWLVTLGTLFDCEAGDASQAAAGIEHLLDLMRRTPPGPSGEYVAPAIVIPLAARIVGLRTASEAVLSCVDAVLSSSALTPRVATEARTGLALLAVEQRSAEQCARLFDQLKPAAGTFSPMLISMDRVLGLLAATTGDGERAERHLQAAVRQCQALGYVPEVAWSCVEYGGWLLGDHDRRDPRKAQQFLRKARELAEGAEMRPLAERAVRLLDRVDVAHHTEERPDELTARELEVLQLVAAGMSNRDIAERLYISVHTVGHHVSSILTKTGAVNRSGAAAYAVRHKLV